MIVVGDRCEGATGELIAPFADPRIRYANLVLNCGDQSGSNNVAMARVRGKYIPFLNQNDCWLPDHLRAAAGEVPGELVARSHLGFRRGTFIGALRRTRGLAAMPERDPPAVALRTRYAAGQPDGNAKPALPSYRRK